MTQADLSIVPAPGTKNYDAMTTAELKDAAYRWILAYNDRNNHLPTQLEVGNQFGKSRGWGRDRFNEMRLSGLISDDGSGEEVDTVAELTAELERADAAREQAINAQREAEANAARIQQRANQTVAEVRAEADRRVAALEGATAERLRGAEQQSTATVEQLQAELERQVRQIRSEAEEKVQRAQREATEAKTEADRQMAALEGASAERERRSQEHAAAELARLKAEHEEQVQEIQRQAEERIADAIASAPSVRREAEDNEAAEVLAATVTEKHHRTLQGLMYGFYGVAAAAALTGQVWAGVEHIPFPNDWHVVAKALTVAPAFAVLEFGGVVTAAAADLRRRLGERATGFRIMSFAAATVAAGFNLVGHWGDWFPAIGFTGLSVFAFGLWLLYSEARRRDVLRNAGMMSRPAPVYGIAQWLRDFKLTLQARRLAVEFGYGTHESLRHAQELKAADAEARRVELEEKEAAELQARRRKAIAEAIGRRIKDRSKDAIGAEIAMSTIDPDRVAAEAEARVSYSDWGDLIAHDLDPYREQQPSKSASVTA